jgi:hypothetical protein
MNRTTWVSLASYILLPLLLVVPLLASRASAEWKEQVLYSFQGIPDGSTPYGGVVFDKAGNLYGTTGWGGSKSCYGPSQCGIVFQLQPQQDGTWTENILYTFKGAEYGDGASPDGGLIIDDAGNLYGTTIWGGTGNCELFGSTIGCGTVFEMSPPQQSGGQWGYAILYSFQGDKDGQAPTGNLTFDKAGNLYGATQHGGGKGHNNCNTWYPYCGTVFRLSPPKQKGGAWTEEVLYSFRSVGDNEPSGDGALPNGGLVLDSKGAIYGTTFWGGDNHKRNHCRAGQPATGCGTAFKLVRPAKKGGQWVEELIHVFKDRGDSEHPTAGLTFDANGQLFGTTLSTVFRLTPPSKKSGQWKLATIYTFTGNGVDPDSSVVFDSGGTLYGTTLNGAYTYSGTVYRLKPPTRHGGSWTYGLVYGFKGAPDGGQPGANLIFDNAGNLYGTTEDGGTSENCSHGCGTVFEVMR